MRGALFGENLTFFSESVGDLDSRRSDRTVPDDRAAVRRLTDWRLRRAGMTRLCGGG